MVGTADISLADSRNDTNELVLRVCGTARDGQLVRLRSPKCSVGSDARCTLRLRAWGVHPMHCLIVRGTSGAIVRRWAADTRLNGRTFDEAALTPGDRLGIGPLEFEVVEAAAAAVPASSPTPAADAAPASKDAETAARFAAAARCGVRQNRRRAKQLAAELRAARGQIAELMAGHEALREAAAQTDARHEELTRRLAAAESARDADQHEWAQRLTVCHFDRNASEDGLAAERAELAQRAETLRLRGDELDQRAATLDGQAAEVNQQTAALDARAAELDARGKSIDVRTAELDSQAADLSAQSAALDNRSAELSARAMELDRHRADIEARSAESGTNAEALAQRTAELDARASELDAQSATLDNRSAEVDVRVAELDRHSAELSARSNEIDARAAELDHHSAEIDARAAEIDAQTETLRARAAELVARAAEITAQAEAGARRPAEASSDDAGSESVWTSAQNKLSGMWRSTAAADEEQADPAPADAEADESTRAGDGAPVDLAAIFRKLGRTPSLDESDEPDESGRSDDREPAPTRSASPSSGHGESADTHHDEESMDDYTARWLARMRGETQQPPRGEVPRPAPAAVKDDDRSASAAPHAPEPTAEAPLRVAGPRVPPTPRAVAPEKHGGLSAMRELAKLSTQSALKQHARRRLRGATRTRLMITLASLAAGSGLMVYWGNWDAPNYVLYSALGAFAIALCWGAQYFLLSARLSIGRRRVAGDYRGREANVAPAELSGDDMSENAGEAALPPEGDDVDTATCDLADAAPPR